MSFSGIFTSASVTEGHPDKLCDQISDAIVDAYLTNDPATRVIAECAAARGILFLAVRGTALGAVDVASVAREVIARAGYGGQTGTFNAETCTIATNLVEQGEPHWHAAGDGDETPADQQTTVFGYASDETPAALPAPIWIAHRIARALAAAGRSGTVAGLAPDGQAQVAVEYRDGVPARLHAVTILAASRTDRVPGLEAFRRDIRDGVVAACLDDLAMLDTGDVRIVVNPSGLIPGGGPDMHAGLTGRKTSIDTYGEAARHSGAALSGKDPGRIDRAAAYAARHAARNVVAAGLARRCEFFLSYDVGQVSPVSVGVETFGTGRLADREIAGRLLETLDFRPGAIRRRFDLAGLPAARDGAFYRHLAAYGQMGRDDLDVPWEATDLGAAIG